MELSEPEMEVRLSPEPMDTRESPLSPGLPTKETCQPGMALPAAGLSALTAEKRALRNTAGPSPTLAAVKEVLQPLLLLRQRLRAGTTATGTAAGTREELGPPAAAAPSAACVPRAGPWQW